MDIKLAMITDLGEFPETAIHRPLVRSLLDTVNKYHDPIYAALKHREGVDTGAVVEYIVLHWWSIVRDHARHTVLEGHILGVDSDVEVVKHTDGVCLLKITGPLDKVLRGAPFELSTMKHIFSIPPWSLPRFHDLADESLGHVSSSFNTLKEKQ